MNKINKKKRSITIFEFLGIMSDNDFPLEINSNKDYLTINLNIGKHDFTVLGGWNTNFINEICKDAKNIIEEIRKELSGAFLKAFNEVMKKDIEDYINRDKNNLNVLQFLKILDDNGYYTYCKLKLEKIDIIVYVGKLRFNIELGTELEDFFKHVICSADWHIRKIRSNLIKEDMLLFLEIFEKLFKDQIKYIDEHNDNVRK